VTVNVTTPFVSMLFTPLDNLPLVDSEHILVTALARDKQTGSEYNADASQLLKTGGPPLLLEPVQATITFKGGTVTSAQSVDIYGVPTGREIERDGNTVTIDGRYATYYYQVMKDTGVQPDGGGQEEPMPGDAGADPDAGGEVDGGTGTDTTAADPGAGDPGSVNGGRIGGACGCAPGSAGWHAFVLLGVMWLLRRRS
jgi:uncharacterized protein (TIGR03382 family)